MPKTLPKRPKSIAAKVRLAPNAGAVGKIRKWGNSAAVLLPKHVTHAADLAIGAGVRFEVRPEGILMRPIGRRQTIEDLLDGVTPDNVDRVEWDPPQGREIF